MAVVDAVHTAPIVVCHSARQHSHQLAKALADRGMLSMYLTGIPTQPTAIPNWQRLFLKNYIETYSFPIGDGLVEHHFIGTAVRKISERMVSRAKFVDWSHRADEMFDYVAARRIPRLQPKMVVAYENAAEFTFLAAKRMGATTVLDAASFHHSWQDNVSKYIESSKVHDRIVAKKDRELELADYVLTVSDLARSSYVEAGFPAEKVVAIPVGSDLERFQMKDPSSANSPVRFVFVGHIDERKGADILRQSALTLSARGTEFRLSLIGKSVSSVSFEKMANCNHLGWMPQSKLALELKNHDVLVLPSRHDSFGMVVAEAMACGLPVIVSDHVGAKEMVVAKSNGDIVRSGDSASLADSMQWFVDHRDRMDEMAKEARRSSEQYTWTEYGKRVCAFLVGIVNN